MKHLTYLASPYSNPDPTVEENRFKITCLVAGLLMNQGLFVFSPIAHCHPIAVSVALPRDYSYWKEYCELTLGQCRELLVLTIDGWETSKGVKGEIEFAEKNNMPIRYVHYRSDNQSVTIFKTP